MGIRLALVLSSALLAASSATAGSTPDLYKGSDTHEGIGQGETKPLQRGASYTGSAFPIRFTIRPPDSLWGGVQYESKGYRFVQLNHMHVPGTTPLTGYGYVSLESATATTPSVAKTVANLRTTPHVRFGPIKPTRVAGVRGRMFDATIIGSDLIGTCDGGNPCPAVVSFAPFLTNHHCGFCGDVRFHPHRETLDVKAAGKGQLFRIIVASVRGKTIVIYIESNYADQKKFPPRKLFPTFLPYAEKMLTAISFA